MYLCVRRADRRPHLSVFRADAQLAHCAFVVKFKFRQEADDLACSEAEMVLDNPQMLARLC
jgi:hypothetical protein